jgi:hypothetical protein
MNTDSRLSVKRVHIEARIDAHAWQEYVEGSFRRNCTLTL